MAVYAIVIMVILAIIMAVFIVLSILKEDSNNKKNQHNIIYPFNAKLQSRDADNPGAQSVNMVTSDGKTPQLQCPANTHIEVIGAWVDIVDPNGLCSKYQNPTFKMSCGFSHDVSAGVTCQSNTDCAPGMQCSGSQQCVPLGCKTNSDCGTTACSGDSEYVGKPCDNVDNNGTPLNFTDSAGLVCIDGIVHKDPKSGQCLYCDTRRWQDGDYTGPNGDWVGYCAQSPTCANIGTDPKIARNPTCTTDENNGLCVPRDASAYLAEQCDGKRTCTITWNPNDPTYFGPKPCNIDVMWTKPTEGPGVAGSPTPPSSGGYVPDYETLPVTAGWGGGPPGSGQYEGSQSKPSTYSQGFYVHGIFSCQPDE